MEFKKGDFVKLLNEKEIYIIDDIKDNEVCIKGYTHRIIKLVNVEDIKLAEKEDIEKENIYTNEVKEKLIRNQSQRSKQVVLYGRILHIDGDKDFLESCLSLYKEMHIPADGIYINEPDVKNKIENILLKTTPDIIVITGHDVYNGKGIKDLNNYENSKHFIDAVRIIRKHFGPDSTVIIVGACGSHFEALIASGANFSSSPKRINIHTYDPAIIAIKVATTSCNRVVDFNQILEYIENKRAAFGGVETKGKMKVLL